MFSTPGVYRSLAITLLLSGVSFPAVAADVNITNDRTTVQVLQTLSPGGTTADITGSVIVDNASNPAIRAHGNAWNVVNNGTVANTSTSTASASSRAFRFEAGGSLVNNGTISGARAGASTIQVDSAAGVFTFNNTGTITAAGSGLASNMNTNVTNSGSIAAGNAAAISLTAGQGTVNNLQGGVLSATPTAVGLSGASGSFTATNAGQVTSTAGRGISASITATTAGNTILITNEATGVVNAYSVGLANNAGDAATNQIINHGSVTSTNEEGILANGGGYIENTGTINSYSNGIRVNSGNAAHNHVVNSGTVTAANGGYTNGIILQSGGRVENTATGIIDALHAGIRISVGGDASTNRIDNAGSIISRSNHGIVLNVAGSVYNTGTVEGSGQGINVSFNDAANYVFNSGTVTGGATGTGVYINGGSLVNEGTITGGTVGITAGGAVNITNSGTITGNGTAGNALLLSIHDDLVRLQTGSVVNGAISGGAGNDTLILEGNGNLLSNINNFEILTIDADATGWQATRAMDFTGGTGNLNTGRFILNNTLSIGSFDTAAATTLMGAGTINGNVTNNGTIAPGNSIGTLTINGNYIAGTGSVYALEVAPKGLNDLIKISGTASLAGDVIVTPLAGGFGPSNTYTILTADGGLGGTEFDSVSSVNSFFLPTLTYDANNVYLQLLNTNATFADLVGGGVGAAFDALPANDPAKQLLLTQNDNEIINSLNAAAQGPYSSQAIVLPAMQARMADTVSARMSGLQTVHAASMPSLNLSAASQLDALQTASGGAAASRYTAFDQMVDESPLGDLEGLNMVSAGWLPEEGKLGGWLQGYGATGKIRDNGSKLDWDFGGVTGGIDKRISENVLAGVALAYARGQTESSPGDAESNNDIYQVTGYSAWRDGALFAQGQLSYGFIKTDTERTISFGGAPLELDADYNTHVLSVSGEVGRDFALQGGVDGKNLTVTPLAGLAYSYQHQQGFTERGSTVGLRIDSDDSYSLKPSLGVKVSAPTELEEGGYIIPSATLRYKHEMGDRSSNLNGTFAGLGGGSPSFAIDGLKRSPNEVSLAVDVSYREKSDTPQLFAAYETTQSSTNNEHAVLIGTKINW